MAGILPQLHIVRKDGFNLGLCLPDVQDAQCRCTGHHIHMIHLSCSEIQHNLSEASLTRTAHHAAIKPCKSYAMWQTYAMWQSIVCMLLHSQP